MISNVFASVPVRHLDAAVQWYERIFGPATSRPIPEVAEWHFPTGGGLQVYELPERAGNGSFTVTVTDIDEQVAALKSAGVESPGPDRTPQVETVMVKDPDGNSIAFAQPGRRQAGTEKSTVGNPVVHFEITGTDPSSLRRYYGQLFGWEFNVGGTVSHKVSDAGNYGFIDANTNGGGINGGVGGGHGYKPRVLFYVSVPNVAAALRKAESLGGKREMGPEGNPGSLVVGWFTDPEGNLVGVAGAE